MSFTPREEIIWPCSLPCALVEGYGYTPTDTRLKTEMEVSGLYRVEFDEDEATCTCSFILDSDQSLTFESFEHAYLRQGSTWFNMPLRIAGQTGLYRVRFRERPQMTQVINQCLMKYSMTLDLVDRNLLCPDQVDALLDYSPGALRTMYADLKNIINTIMPGITNPPAIYFP